MGPRPTLDNSLSDRLSLLSPGFKQSVGFLEHLSSVYVFHEGKVVELTRLALINAIAEHVAPKYRNPKDPSQTWTGRGRRPTWIVEAGGNIERFLIS